jgi:hypothetical protein
MRDDDSDDTPVVLLRLPPERELPRCRCGAAYTIGVTTREPSVLLRRVLRRGA